jgi:hypothetical protein
MGAWISLILKTPRFGQRRSKEIVMNDKTVVEPPFRTQYFSIRFFIDRNEICINCDIALAYCQKKLLSDPQRFEPRYPPFNNDVAPTDIPQLAIEGTSEMVGIKEVADTM